MAGESPVPAEDTKKSDSSLNQAEHHALANLWHQLIGAAGKHRKKFRDGWDVARKFAYGDHEFMYEDTMPDAEYKATVPKVWEMINIFGPMLSFKNPHRNVRVRFEGPEDPRAPRAEVYKRLLNYSANELDLASQVRESVDESIIGLGCMWLENDPISGLWGHFHDSAMNCYVDPDAETLKDAWWIARKHMMPRWKFADMVDVAIDSEHLPNAARPTVTSALTASDTKRDGDKEYDKAGKTHDLLPVYEVWSRMGMGWRCRDVSDDFYDKAKWEDEKPERMYRHFYVLLTSDHIFKPGKWPVPLWADNDWPVEWLFYRKKSDYLWPIPFIQPSLGLQKAMNWVMMFLWSHMRVASRQLVAGPKSLDESTKERIINGLNLEYIDVDDAEVEKKDIEKIIGFLRHPELNTDLWRYVDLVSRMFEDSTGLYPALYAASGGAEPRSATADQSRQARADLRPDDMRERVEALHTRMARKEAIAMTLDDDFTPEKVAEILGPEMAQFWPDKYEKGTVERVMREYDFRIEAGSAAKPNEQTEKDQALEVYDRMAQVAGELGDIEALNRMSVRMQRTMHILDADIVTFNPPEPPPDPAQQKAELDAQIAQMEAQITQQEAQQSMGIDAAKAQQDMAIDAEKAQQSMELDRMKAELDRLLARRKAQSEVENNRLKAAAAAKAAARKPAPSNGR